MEELYFQKKKRGLLQTKMENISKDEFNEATPKGSKKAPEEKVDEKNFEELLKEMENPIAQQKKLAVQIKRFLDKRIKKEMESDKAILSDNTRRWVDSYNSILEKLQKALHGDKSVSLHVNVSHSDIATKIRESYK